MKHTCKSWLTVLACILMLVGLTPLVVCAADSEIIVLYTNDIHCATEHYATLAAYRAELIDLGYTVITVDAGDHIQGEAIGAITKGAAIIDLMNETGYDLAVPGNHEFDYTTDTFLDLTYEAEFSYIAANFIDLVSDAPVFAPYEIINCGEEQIAFVGIATPETYTKSTPTYFQDENGNFMYSFGEDELYTLVQDAVDAAVADGADRVIAVGHLGITGTTEGWKSTDVIANTTGIDAFIDAHTHELIAEDIYQNQNGEDVPLSSTSTKFAYFGQLVLGEDGSAGMSLIDPNTIDVESLSDAAQEAYQTVKEKVDAYNDELSYLYEVLGTAQVDLTLNDPATDEWVIRMKETNMGDFVADAYRAVTGADAAFVNGGGVRAAITAGDVTRKALMDVNPWSNDMCVIAVSGQQILDALEFGARMSPEVNAGFLHVSGLTYDIEAWKDSPVVTDDIGNFVSIDDTKERRVANVTIGDEPLDPEKTYTLTASAYMLLSGGDGFTMFKDAQIVQSEGLPTDADMLIEYFTEHLGGTVTAAQYGNALGDGRIAILTEKPAEDTTNTTTPSKPATQSPQTGNSAFVLLPLAVIALAVLGIAKAAKTLKNDR